MEEKPQDKAYSREEAWEIAGSIVELLRSDNAIMDDNARLAKRFKQIGRYDYVGASSVDVFVAYWSNRVGIEYFEKLSPEYFVGVREKDPTDPFDFPLARYKIPYKP